jgi:subtilase family serine protease
MKNDRILALCASLVLGLCAGSRALPQEAVKDSREAVEIAQASAEIPQPPSRVVEAIDETRLVTLRGNTHPLAEARFDKGLVDPGKLLERIVLVLKRSPEQEAALAAFNERQYDPKSPDFHHWLHAEEFGQLYGPSDADMALVTNWLENHGFQIYLVTKGRVSIQFTGTVAQVEAAFHVEMHNYLVNGEMHIANDRDPQIPQALAPVITGIGSLNNFFPKHYSHPGNYVKRDLKTGKYTELDSNSDSARRARPEFGYIDPTTSYQREMLTPYDVATIYNILPLWKESTPINGKGVKVAIVALSDVVTSDFNTYRSSFGLPVGTLVTLHSGADPGITTSKGENTEDTEMVSATAPGAEIVLVADVDNATTDGLVTAVTYIVENEVAPILTMSYGACELDLGSGGNSLYSQTFQQAATAGISSFVAAGDSGSAVCTSQDGTPPYADTYGLAVSGMASNQYVTAVGGTDLAWPFSTNAYTTYWNTTNDPTTGASALGYMPETAWNTTCTNPLLLLVYTNYDDNEALCNAAVTLDKGLVEMASGGGGVSACTTPTGSTPETCKGSWPKPSWQTGVKGIPAANQRALPDVAMFASYGFQNSTGIPGSALLICQASLSPNESCDYSNLNYIIYQENGGTSAASPMTAGIMAMVVQKTGSAQGLANPVLYQLAAKENYADCDSNTVQAGNTCIFYDTTTGSNAMVCITGDPDCVTSTSGDTAGILKGYSATEGYDLTTGLGTFNVANLVNAWPKTSPAKPAATLTPATLTFPKTTEGLTSSTLVATLKNTSTTALTIATGGITISGTGYLSFPTKATTCPASKTAATTLAAGASCTVTIEFSPKTAGTLTAYLEVADNATGSPQKITLTGTGLPKTTVPSITLSPASIAFPKTTEGTTSEAEAVTVKNSGTAAVTLHSVSIAGTNPTSFIQVNTCGASLAANASCTVFVAFKPASAAALKGTLSVSDTAAATPQTIPLTGTGTAKDSVTLSKTSLAFASTVEGAASEAQSITVSNKGATTLDITGISVTGVTKTDAASFIELNTCAPTLAPATSCVIDVAFKPAAIGALAASLVIADNGSTATQTVKLTGTGAK